MSDYPATTLALNKGKYYVLLTIPADLRQYFNGRKQLKRSTGTNDLNIAKQKQHGITTDLYAELDTCKPDLRDVISELLGWIGDADEIQRLEDNGDLEGTIMAQKYAENFDDPEDPDDDATDLVNAGGAKALEVYREWKASLGQKPSQPNAIVLSVASTEYLATTPYGPEKTMRDCELALSEFTEYTGDVVLSEITPVLIHKYAEQMGKTKSRETISKKVGYVRRLFDHAVRKGWLQSNVFLHIKLDKNLGRKRLSYIPFTKHELSELFSLEMDQHLKQLLSILAVTGMRLDEAALLNWHDVKHDAEQGVTYFDITEATVKNEGSHRMIPVHSKLTWVAPGKTGQMFPQFKRDADGKAQSAASKALMKLIRRVTDHKQKTVHSLRGNFKDMLRDAGVSKEVNGFITGHGAGDVAGKYGAGPSLSVRKEAVERVSFDFV